MTLCLVHAYFLFLTQDGSNENAWSKMYLELDFSGHNLILLYTL